MLHLCNVLNVVETTDTETGHTREQDCRTVKKSVCKPDDNWFVMAQQQGSQHCLRNRH